MSIRSVIAYIEAKHAAKVAKKELIEKIYDEVNFFEMRHLTEDQAMHAVAHARNISLREVEHARKQYPKMCQAEQESADFWREVDAFFYSTPIMVLMFVLALFFMWYFGAK